MSSSKTCGSSPARSCTHSSDLLLAPCPSMTGVSLGQSRRCPPGSRHSLSADDTAICCLPHVYRYREAALDLPLPVDLFPLRNSQRQEKRKPASPPRSKGTRRCRQRASRRGQRLLGGTPLWRLFEGNCVSSPTEALLPRHVTPSLRQGKTMTHPRSPVRSSSRAAR